MRLLFAFMFSLVLVGCGGYEPVVKYSKNLFAEPVLVKVKIDPEDPSTGEYLQDEISRMAINRLNLSTTKNVDEAKGYILVNRYTINTTPVTKDNNGNVIRYSINAAIKFAVKDKKGFWSKNIVSSEYVGVKAESSVSQVAKDKASKIAIRKALDSFVLAVIKRGKKKKKELAKMPANKEPKLIDSEESNYNNSNLNNSNSVETQTNNSQEPTTPVVSINSSTNNIDDNVEKPWINLVVVDDDNSQNGNNLDSSSDNEDSAEVIDY